MDTKRTSHTYDASAKLATPTYGNNHLSWIHLLGMCFVSLVAISLLATQAAPTARAGINVWTSVGQANINVGVLAINPITPTTLYAGTSGGIFKSTDGGGNWSAADNGLSGGNVYALAINPITPTTLYAGTIFYGSVFKSIDGGANWNAVNAGRDSYDVMALAIDPVTPETVYAGGGRMFKSTDGGTNWNAAYTGLTDPSVWALAINPITPTTLYAGTGGGVFKSTDGAANWSTVNIGLTNTNVRALAINPITPTTLYAGTYGGVFKTTDGGAHWNAVNAGLTTTYVRALAIDPTASGTIYAGTGGGGVFKSIDGGAHWNAVNAGLTNTSVRAVAVNPTTPETVYAGTEGGGVFVTDFLPNPIPALASIDPTGSIAGGSIFTLALTGTNFVPGSLARWSGTDLVTSFVNSTSLTATVPAVNIAGSGVFSVTVFNPPPGGGSSNGVTFVVSSGVPTLAALNPTGVTAGGSAFTLALTGTNFMCGSVARWNSADLATGFVNSATLTATIPAANIANTGIFSITVFNPAPGGGSSNVVTFTVYASVDVSPATGGTTTFTSTTGTQTEIQVPGGAVAAPTTLQWTPQTTCTHATAPANFQFAGITFQLDALQGGVLQPGFQFLTPITLILHYTDQDVAGLQEATLELDYWDEASGSWQDAACGAGYTRDPVNNQLTVEICHLSEFGLFGSQNTWLYVPLVTH